MPTVPLHMLTRKHAAMIIAAWDEWETQSGQQAQQDQHPQAGFDMLTEYVVGALENMLGEYEQKRTAK